jgi:uncharacterized protein YjlB
MLRFCHLWIILLLIWMTSRRSFNLHAPFDNEFCKYIHEGMICFMANQTIVPAEEIIHEIIQRNQWFPNNAKLPLLLYKHCFHLPEKNSCDAIESIFLNNHWKRPWKNGIYPFHHYHSNTHEVLGICEGSCRVQVGGENGKNFILEKGDVLIIPAGVSHKNLHSTPDFACVGAYPFEIDYDTNKGTQLEYFAAEEKMQQVLLPQTDPVYGRNGLLFQYWK